MIGYVLLAALLPIALLAWYIYRKDKLCPEPPGQLIKGFCFGAISAPLSLGISLPFIWLGLCPVEATSIGDSFRTAFISAAIPEESAKLFMLWLLLRNNKYFDEKMDGIVYAVFVSLGFAALENILYLIKNYDSWLSVGIGRALFAIPGHFCHGIIMGYYYSLAKFYPKSPTRNKILVWVAPVLAHGIYDSILFIAVITPAFSGILTIVFLVFCHKLWKYGRNRMKEHLERDLESLFTT